MLYEVITLLLLMGKTGFRQTHHTGGMRAGAGRLRDVCRYDGLAVQVIDGNVRRGMVRSRVAAAMPGDRLLDGMIVRAILLVQRALRIGQLCLAESAVNQRQIIVCRKVLRLDLQCLQEPVTRAFQLV